MRKVATVSYIPLEALARVKRAIAALLVPRLLHFFAASLTKLLRDQPPNRYSSCRGCSSHIY